MPTQNLDIDGTLRIRELPLDEKENAIFPTVEETNKTQKFEAKSIVVANDDGVLGEVKKDVSAPTDLNDSNAMFVIRRYQAGDWLSGRDSRKGYDTGMSSNKWEAFLTVPGFLIESGGNPFGGKGSFGWFLYSGEGNKWRIVGDVGGVTEDAIIDVLFIKKEFVATDDRTRKPIN